MNYLAFDASTEACSVALTFNGQILSEFELCPQSHSLVLLPMIDRILTKAQCKLTDLDGLIFGQGPGSFTGVRIGVGVAQGLAFSAELNVVGISTMQAMAQQAYIDHQQTEVIATIDARMSEVYAGCYQLNDQGIMAPVVAETVLPPKALLSYLTENNPATTTDKLLMADQVFYGVGSGWDAYQTELGSLKSNSASPKILFPDARAMLVLGEHSFKQGQGVSAEHAQPVYVRDTVSWKKLPGR